MRRARRRAGALEASGGVTLGERARDRRDRRRLHLGRRTDALGAGARPQPALRLMRLLVATGFALLVAAAPAQAGFRDSCETHDAHTICTGMVESFDGTPLSTTLTLPAERQEGRAPAADRLPARLPQQQGRVHLRDRGGRRGLQDRRVQQPLVRVARLRRPQLRRARTRRLRRPDRAGQQGLRDPRHAAPDRPARRRRDGQAQEGRRGRRLVRGRPDVAARDRARQGRAPVRHLALAEGPGRAPRGGGPAVHLDRPALLARAERAEREDDSARRREDHAAERLHRR